MPSLKSVPTLANVSNIQLEPTITPNKWRSYRSIWQHVSIELTLWFYMMGTMMVSIVEQSFYGYKACRADLKFDRKGCLYHYSNNDTTVLNHIQVILA